MGMGQLFACQWYIAVAQNIDTGRWLAMMITYLAAGGNGKTMISDI